MIGDEDRNLILPGIAELQLGSPGDADNNREGPGTAELKLGSPCDAANNRKGPGTADPETAEVQPRPHPTSTPR